MTPTDWFFYQDNGQTVGPFTLDTLRGHIHEGRLKAYDLLYREGEESWQVALRHPQVRDEFGGDEDVGLEDRPWICLHRKEEDTFDFVTKGPFSEEDVREGLELGHLSYGDYVWKHGLLEWVRLGSQAEFNSRLKTEPPAEVAPQATLSPSRPLENIPPPLKAETAGHAVLTLAHRGRAESLPNDRPTEAATDDLTKSDVRNFDFDPDRTRVVHVAPEDPVTATPVAEKAVKAEKVEKSQKFEIRAKMPEPPPETKSSGLETVSPNRLYQIFGAAAGLLTVCAVVFALMHRRHSAPRHVAAVASNPAPIPVVIPQTEVKTAPAPQPNASAPTVSLPIQAAHPLPNVVPTKVATPKSAARVVAPKAARIPQIRLDVRAPRGNVLRVDLRSDANAGEALDLEIIGLPGQISVEGASYLSRRFASIGHLSQPVATPEFKLPPGRYAIRASVGATGVKITREINVDLKDSDGHLAVARARKSAHHAMVAEQALVNKVSLELETAMGRAIGKPLNASAFKILEGYRPGATKRIFILEWLELKSVLAAARVRVNSTLIARVVSVRKKVASVMGGLRS